MNASRFFEVSKWLLSLLVFAVLSMGADGVSSQSAASGTPQTIIDPSLYQALKYRPIGPYRGGRCSAVTGVRGQPHTFYMGTGGVWKTVNAGLSWENISDGFFETGSIGAIDVADSDSSVIYVGTGQSTIRGNVSTGKGIYKSTDAGKTWVHVGLRNAGQICGHYHPSFKP